MRALRISFPAGTPINAAHGGEPAFFARLEGGVLSVGIKYTASPDMLVLRGAANAGDKAELTVLPWRVTLCVNGAVVDEDWPFGGHFLRDIRIPGANIGEFGYSAPAEPAVVGEFTGAEGWNPGGGVFVGDCMPYVCGGRFHVLFLLDRHHHQSKFGRGAHRWGHISSSDLKKWQIHPVAVDIDDESEGSICTGSHVERGGTHYLFYTVRAVDGSPAPVRRSVSRDCVHFEKDRGFGFVLPEKYDSARARDPKIVRAPDGSFHMLITTSLVGMKRGCLAHFVSYDLDEWRECGDPVYISPDATEPECPDHVFFGGKYYLVFSLGAVGRYMVSDSPFSGFEAPENNIIDCRSVPKCAPFGGGLMFVGYSAPKGTYAGTMTFTRARQAPGGELVFDSGIN